MDLEFGEELREILILESGNLEKLMVMAFILGLMVYDFSYLLKFLINFIKGDRFEG